MAAHPPHNRRHTSKRNPIQIPEPGQKTQPPSPDTDKSPPTKTKVLPQSHKEHRHSILGTRIGPTAERTKIQFTQQAKKIGYRTWP